MARTAKTLKATPLRAARPLKSAAAPDATTDELPAAAPQPPTEPPVPVADLFAAVADRLAPPIEPPPSASARAASPDAPRAEPPEPRPVRAKAKAASLKPGVGLKMVTPEGEESIVPFKSVEDLLSGIKPYLRDAARSPEPVWFCLETIDLANFDPDA